MKKKCKKKDLNIHLYMRILRKSLLLDFTYCLNLRSNLALADSAGDLPISTMRLLGVERDGVIGVYILLLWVSVGSD